MKAIPKETLDGLRAGDAVASLVVTCLAQGKAADSFRQAYLRRTFALRDAILSGERRRADRRASLPARVLMIILLALAALIATVSAPAHERLWWPIAYRLGDEALARGDDGEALRQFAFAKPYADAEARMAAVLVGNRQTLWAEDDTLFAVTNDGRMLAAGRYAYELESRDTVGFVDAVVSGDGIVALRGDGTLQALSGKLAGVPFTESGLVSIEEAYGTIVGLREDGRLTSKTHGGGLYVALRDGAARRYDGKVDLLSGSKTATSPKSWEDIRDAAGAYRHSAALRPDGRAIVWASGKEDILLPWENVVAVDAGAYHIVCLLADGTVKAYGSNPSGQMNVAAWRDIVAIAAGNDFTAGLRADGTVVITGSDEYHIFACEQWRDVAVPAR